jgi:hypothetical protein
MKVNIFGSFFSKKDGDEELADVVLQAARESYDFFQKHKDEEGECLFSPAGKELRNQEREQRRKRLKSASLTHS